MWLQVLPWIRTRPTIRKLFPRLTEKNLSLSETRNEWCWEQAALSEPYYDELQNIFKERDLKPFPFLFALLRMSAYQTSRWDVDARTCLLFVFYALAEFHGRHTAEALILEWVHAESL